MRYYENLFKRDGCLGLKLTVYNCKEMVNSFILLPHFNHRTINLNTPQQIHKRYLFPEITINIWHSCVSNNYETMYFNY